MTIARLAVVSFFAALFLTFMHQDAKTFSPEAFCTRAAEAAIPDPELEGATMVGMTCNDTKNTYQADIIGTAVKVSDKRWVTASHVMKSSSRMFLVDTSHHAHEIKTWQVNGNWDIAAFDMDAPGIERDLASSAPGEGVKAYGPYTGNVLGLKVAGMSSDPLGNWRGQYMQLDGLVLHGYSGGPILDSEGKLIAISYAIFPTINKTYAVPVSAISSMM